MKRPAMRYALMCSWGTIAIILLSAAGQAATCNLSTVSGNYAVATIGQQAGAYQVEVFLMTSDGNGNLSGSGAESLNGTIHTGVSMTGKYTVGSNCLFTSLTADSIGNTFHITGQIAQSGAQITGISTDAAELKYTAYSQHLTSCTQASSAGDYIFQLYNPLTPFGPSIASGQATVAATGKGTGFTVGNYSGTIVRLTNTTTFTTNSNCTFTAVTESSNGATATAFGVAGIEQNDVESLYIATDSGWVTLGTGYIQ